MTPKECESRISSKLDKLRSERHTGKAIIEIDMNQGGFGNVSFYTSMPIMIRSHCALFAGSNGPFVIKKYI